MKMKECKKFVNFCKTYLNVPKAKVKIKIDKEFHAEDACVHHKKGHKYIITLGSIDLMDNFVYMILAHEMTHVKQFELDGLELYYKGRKSRFNGQIYDIDLDNDSEYFSAPWEVEARINEVPITYYYNNR